MNLCKCGCGQEAKSKKLFIKGHHRKGVKASKQTLKRMSLSQKGKLLSKETCRKMSASHKGKKCPEHSQRMRGANNPRFGKHLLKETKEQISKSLSGKNHPLYGKKCTKHSERMKGKNNPNWNGGSSFFPYSPEWTQELKQFIKNRDNNECQNPYCDRKNKELDIHHINYSKENCNQFNLITLCRSCHSQSNWNRNKWKHFYKKIVWSKY